MEEREFAEPLKEKREFAEPLEEYRAEKLPEASRHNAKKLPAVPEKKRSKAGKIFVRSTEVVAIGGSFLASSRLARFVTAFFGSKAEMDIVIAVTERFGAPAARQLSTIFAGINGAVAAEPRVIALAVTGVIVVLNMIAFLFRSIGKHRRKRRYLREIQAGRKE